MATQPGKCIFCGSGGLSKEHVLGLWLKDWFPRDASTTRTQGLIQPSAIWGVPKITDRNRQGHSGTTTVRVVCKTCNNGWLSRLEETVKPILPPLIEGRRVGITPENQQILATWAAKTAITAEHVSPRSSGGIDSETRRRFMETKLPPPNWVVWIAGYEGGLWGELGIAQNRGRLQSGSPASFDEISDYVHATTFGAGAVVFLVVGSKWDRLSEVFAPYDGNGLIQIWPRRPRSILWPQNVIFSDTEVNTMANVLSASGVFDNSLNPLGKWPLSL